MMEIDSSIRAKWHGGKRKLSDITAIVMHYTANTGQMATAKGNARYFEGGSEGRKASAHYVVDEGETAYECVPLRLDGDVIPPGGVRVTDHLYRYRVVVVD